MTRAMSWRLKLSVLTLLVLSAGALGALKFQDALGLGASNGAPLRNYGVVWEHELTRSGLPRNDSGWRWLREQGVRSIVTFRTENDVDYNKFRFEHVLRIPMLANPPSDQQAEQFLQFIQDPANQPVHIHCSAGRDRTGLMTALARYSIDAWTLEKALAEARTYRGGKDLSAKRVAWLSNWAAQHPPGSYQIKR